MATHSSPALAPYLKATLARGDGLPELREQLGRALDRLNELTRKPEDQQRRSVSIDEFLSMATRVARNVRSSVAYLCIYLLHHRT